MESTSATFRARLTGPELRGSARCHRQALCSCLLARQGCPTVLLTTAPTQDGLLTGDPHLRPHQATFLQLIENAPFGVYVVDAQFRMCQASAATRRAFSTVPRLIGADFAEIVRTVWPEPFASDVLARFRHTLDTGEPYAAPDTTELRKDVPGIESYDWKIERNTLPDGQFGVVCYFYDLTERQQAAEALRLRTAQFETLVNDAPLGIYLLDSSLRVRQVNPAARGAFGTIPDLIGSEFGTVMQTLWGPERAAEIVRQFQHTLSTGTPYVVAELIDRRADRGTTEYYEWQINRLPLPDGSLGVVCYFRDISERVLAQATIRDSEMRFRAFVMTSADVVYRMSPDWREMRHLEGRNFIADTHSPSINWQQEYIHPEDWPQVQEVISAAVAAGSNFELEHRVRRVDGSVGWTRSRAVPLRGADGAVVEWFGTASDVTLAHEAQQALAESEERYRNLFNSMDEGFCSIEMIFDEAGKAVDWRFLEVNPAFAKLTGIEDAVGRRMRDIAPEHEDHWFETYGRVARTGQAVRFVNDAKSLQERWFDLYALKLGGPESRKVAVLFTNITERKRIEAELIGALAAAEAANRAKSDFLSNMSHELRSPLNSVLGFAQLLQTGKPPPTPLQEESVNEILKAGWYLLGLIDEILDLALIESGRLSCALEPVPLAAVLDDCHALVEGQAAQSGIALRFEPVDAGCVVSADSTRLKQVLINILSNAIKYNRPRGTVQVRVAEAEQGRLCISVEDSGAGLSPGQIERLFQPFERLGQQAGAIAGSGIGLAFSKRLVELMGGRIGVHSVVGQGSVFWVELGTTGAALQALPAAPALAATPGEPLPAWPPSTVLCVEDNPANLLLVQRLLARHPTVRLLMASDGNHGLQLARALKPDVVLMDINLPGLSGLEAQRQLAEDAATAHIPVIAISAHAMRHDVDMGLQAGFFRYLIKPIKIDALIEALDAALTLAHGGPPPTPPRQAPP
jgi:PAS domain S-box-containing protein